MSGQTIIEWTDKVWNPTRGCSRVSPGCGTGSQGGCYAERMAYRFSGPGKPYQGLVKMTKDGPRWTGKVALIEQDLFNPLRWREGANIFVNSMSDLFHEQIPDQFIDRVFAVMIMAKAIGRDHIFQILTKRAERMLSYMTKVHLKENVISAARILFDDDGCAVANSINNVLGEGRNTCWPPNNVWLGISVEDQQRADERIPLLLQTPASIRFLSCEPLLGSIDLWSARYQLANGGLGSVFNWGKGVNWVIVGAESGRGARPMQEEWVRDIKNQCVAASVPFFLKQYSTPKGKKIPLPILDGQQWLEMPEVQR